MVSERMHFAHHVGASWAGTTCTRELWLRYRNVFRVQEAPPQIAPCGVDIFTIGKEAEAGIVAMMRGQGHTIFTTPAEAREGGFDPARWSADPEGVPDEQIHILNPEHPYISGFLDGVILDPAGRPGDLEIKTMASHKFYRCKDQGICAEYPQYRMQIQIYMHLTGMRWGMFVYAARGEDGRVDPSIEWFVNRERVEYDPTFASAAVGRIENTVTSHHLPSAASICPEYCRYYPICNHTTKEAVFPLPTCRTCSRWWDCSRATLVMGAQTVCGFYSPISDILPAKIRKSFFADEPRDSTRLQRYLEVSGQHSVPESVVISMSEVGFELARNSVDEDKPLE